MWPFKKKPEPVAQEERKLSELDKISILIAQMEIWKCRYDSRKVVVADKYFVEIEDENNSSGLITIRDYGKTNKEILKIRKYDYFFRGVRIIDPKYFFAEKDELSMISFAYETIKQAEDNLKKEQSDWVKNIISGGDNVAV